MSTNEVNSVHSLTRGLETLTTSEAQLRAFTQVLPDVALVIDEDGLVIDILNPDSQLLYMEAKQAIGLLLHQIFPKHQADDFVAVIHRAIKTGDLQVCEYSLEVPVGFCWFEARVALIPVETDNKPVVMWLARDITASKKAEEEIAESQYYFENLDRISKAITQATDIEDLLFHVAQEILEIFQVDRAFFIHPCDPSAPTWSVPIEATVPEYPGMFALKTELPRDETSVRGFELVLDSDEPLVFVNTTVMQEIDSGALDLMADGQSSDYHVVEFEVLSEALLQFDIKSMIAIAIRPKVGKPWQLGVHQCAYFRRWSDTEIKLFREIAGRVTDSLTNFVLFRQLEEDIVKRKRSEQCAQELLEQNRALTQRLFNTQEEERRHISRELHDEFGQLLTAINIHAQFIYRQHDTTNAKARESARIVAEGTAEIIQNIHNMISQLRPSSLDDLGLKVTLQELIRQTQQQHPELNIEIDLHGNLDDLGENINITLYRVVQEAITNVIKHAKARYISIELFEILDSEVSRSAQLTIQDDGVGIDVNEVTQGMGLTGMRERILATGGEIYFDSSESGGVLINALIPID